MKLDVDALRYLSKEDFRVLTAVEMGMRNHELVPAELVERIACLKRGGTYKVLKNLLKHKLVHHDSSKYDGYRLTYLGYDFLAIKALVNRGVFSFVGRQIGVGKESDIFEVATEDGTVLVMKLHRLGRISFRAVKSKRDYLLHRRSYNWLYLSRLAALKEYAFMKALGEHGFPVPNAVDCNRHCVVMALVQGYPLAQVKQLQNPDEVFEKILGVVVRLAGHGLIHCDFNEFNIMIDDEESITMIDFPQMVSVSHRNAQMYFDRDVECIFKFFRKRFHLSYQSNDVHDDFGSEVEDADKELAASGFTKKNQSEMDKFIEGDEQDTDSSDEECDSESLVEKDGSTALHSSELFDKLDTCFSDGENDKLDPALVISLAVDAIEEETSEEKEGGEEGGVSDDSTISEDGDTALKKQLNKQRQRAMAVARGGRKAISSRNAYKDKGSKSSRNSIMQRQSCKW
ncbi:hypothetical protein HPP92_020192 [Vanilla planifolia]|uniref:Serine/threonine-protein kinase RIO2 n=1 Tax=Vanilla planifolia TaxID=51239 RepID=A0A835ULN2_VANPL|nr:hypothetical protein HPP92_020192 [Vanilla planifolia]